LHDQVFSQLDASYGQCIGVINLPSFLEIPPSEAPWHIPNSFYPTTKGL